jgi:hypothetical protein
LPLCELRVRGTRLVDGRWVPTFARARYVMGRTEFDYWKTRRELFARFAGTPTLVLGGHFAGGRIARDGDAFRLVD